MTVHGPNGVIIVKILRIENGNAKQLKIIKCKKIYISINYTYLCPN